MQNGMFNSAYVLINWKPVISSIVVKIIFDVRVVNLAKYQWIQKGMNVSVSLFDILEHLGHFTFNQSLSFNKGFPLLKSILIGNLTGRSFVGTGCAPQFLQ